MRETVSPEEIEKATFATALRGYDRDEVDSYLRSLAVDLKEAEKQRTERFYQSLGEEMGGLLQHARDSSDAMVKEAEEESKRLRESARSDAEQMRADASKDAKETRANAESEAAANIAEAEQRAVDTRTKAEEDARAREGEADRRVRELEAIESETRERIEALRVRLSGIADQLRHLDGDKTAEDSDETPATAEGAEKDDETVRLEPEVESAAR